MHLQLLITVDLAKVTAFDQALDRVAVRDYLPLRLEHYPGRSK